MQPTMCCQRWGTSWRAWLGSPPCSWATVQQLHSSRGRLNIFLDRDDAAAMSSDSVRLQAERGALSWHPASPCTRSACGGACSRMVQWFFGGGSSQLRPGAGKCAVQGLPAANKGCSGIQIPVAWGCGAEIRNLPQALHKQGVAAAVMQAAGYKADVLIGDHHRDAETALGDRIAGMPDNEVLCAIRAPAADQQLTRIPRLMQWPGVPGTVKILVQPSRVIPVGSHSAPPAHSYSTDTLESATQGIFWVPDQRPFPASCRVSGLAAASQPQPDVIEMAAAMGAAEAAAADEAADATIEAAGDAAPKRSRQRPLFETMQLRLIKEFVKPVMADMLLALSHQRRTGQKQTNDLQRQISQFQQQVAAQASSSQTQPPAGAAAAANHQGSARTQQPAASQDAALTHISAAPTSGSAQQPPQQPVRPPRPTPRCPAAKRSTPAQRERAAQQAAVNACTAHMQAMQDDWQQELEEVQSELEQQAGAVYWQREAAQQQVVDLGNRLPELGEQLRQLRAVEAVSSGGVVQDTPAAAGSSPDDSENMPILTASQRRRRRKVYARRGVARAATLQQQVHPQQEQVQQQQRDQQPAPQQPRR